MTDPLTEMQAARAELHRSVYWPSAAKQKGKNHLWLTDQHLAAAIAAMTQPLPPPATPGLYALTLTPNWNNEADANDVANNLNAVWVWSNNSVGYTPPNYDPVKKTGDIYRVLLLDPRLQDAKGKPGVDEWWFVIRRLWPSSFDPKQHGKFATHTSFHNVASSDGPGGGVGWGFGSGVSAILFQWRPQDPTPSFGFEYVKSGGLIMPVPLPKRDVMHEYVLRFVAGRTDGTTVRPGAYEIMVDGGPATIGQGNINTIQKNAPQGSSTQYVQQWIAAGWDGDYGQDLTVPSQTGFCLTGAGPTLAAARADVPIAVGGTFASQGWNQRQPNDGAPQLVTP